MASRIEAIQAYCPRVQRGLPAQPQRYLELITLRTTLSNGVIKNVQESEVETLIGMLLDGQAVHTGTAVYTPYVDLSGRFFVQVRANSRLLNALNVPGAYRGPLLNAENIGLTSTELIDMWNIDHPTDPVV